MTNSLGEWFNELFQDVVSHKPDFTLARERRQQGDRIVGPAPDDYGRILVEREKLKQQNRRRIISGEEIEDNLLKMDVLEKSSRALVRRAVPANLPETERKRLRVCMEGHIILKRH